MAEDLGDRTEAPTQRRLEQAREKGQVAKSADLVAAIDLIVAALLLWYFGSAAVHAGIDLMDAGLRIDRAAEPLDARTAGVIIGRAFLTMAPVGASALLILTAVTVAAHIQQTRLVWSTEALAPKVERLNPVEGLQRLFARKNLVRGGMNTGKLFFALAVVGLMTWSRADRFATLPRLDFTLAMSEMARLVMEIVAWLVALLLTLGVADYLFQRWQTLQDLRMTKQQIKDERKETDGDAEIKSRIQRIGRQIAMGQLKRDVPKADVIVTNPTHYAIALRYDPATMSAPRVVAKGVDFMAFRIREIAIAAGVPVVEKPELARALYKHAKVGQPIDTRFFQAVAEVLAYVYRLQGRAA
ncbi:MAG: EscU/YscU/HrcU family type III secretion system export apparatus switch protein [Phycisphaerales bacterium]|nr:EscU/YscU/HrcU family type III secretion system export apparatus switch protein [Phycisphaerales bacterium]